MGLLYINGLNQVWIKVVKSLAQGINSWYESLGHLKNVDYSTSTLIFAKIDLSVN